MAEMQKKLNNLLEECDDKIKHLEDLNIKWADFNQNLGDLKSWVGVARTKLDQILTIDISPDDRVRMTKELQGDVKDKMKRLENLEKDAEALYGDGSVVASGLRGEVSDVKRDVEALNVDVDEHSANVAKDLEYWQEYQDDLAKVRPWLEKAEIKIAMGLSRPASLEEALKEQAALQGFGRDVDSMRDAIKAASDKGAKMSCSNSVAEEMDALMSRWKAVKTTSDQWNVKMAQLVGSWKGLEKSYKDMKDWMDEKEKVIQQPLEKKTLEGNVLNKSLDELKALNTEITMKQSNIIDLSKDCDMVAPNLTQESAGNLRAGVSSLKDRLTKLSDESRRRTNELSDAILVQQDFQSKLDDFGNWLKELSSRTKALNEVPSDKIDVSLELCHDLSQQHEDKRVALGKIKKESQERGGGSEALQSIDELEKKYNELGVLLSDKKQALKRWASFWNWHADSVASLKHLQQTIESGQTSSPADLEGATAELDNLAVQCQTRKAEGSDDEQMAAKSKTYVIQGGKPMSILLLVADILQKIVHLKDLVRIKETQIQKLDEKWDEFREAEQRLADWLQIILQKVQKINVKDNTIDALRKASQEVAAVKKECDDKSSLKEIYHAIGKELIAADPSQTKLVQDALTEATSKWDKVASLLQEQQAKSESLLSRWENCIAMRNEINAQLSQVQDVYDAVCEPGAIKGPKDIPRLIDMCKKGLDSLKKLRHPFESYYKKLTQLIQELQTVPSFDVTPLKAELQEVQQRFTFLGVHLKARLSDLESQLVVWRQLQQSKDELLNWIADAKGGMQDALSNVSDAELARIKLSKYTNELPAYLNMKKGIDQKIEQLQKLNKDLPPSVFKDLSDAIEKELGEAEELSKELNSTLGDLGANTKSVRDAMKEILDRLSKLREQAIKCDDTSGDDAEIFARWETSKKILDDVDGCEEKLSEIEEKIQGIKKRYGSADTNVLLKELANLERRYENVSSQVGKTNSTLYGILEKHYVELLQDEMKQLHSNKEKIAWCQPEAGSDKYSLESKLDTVQEIIKHLTDKGQQKGSLEASADIMMKVVEDDKVPEIQSSIMGLAGEKSDLLKKAEDVKKKLLEMLDKWKKYENGTETLASWLKETEEEFRQQLSKPVEIGNFREVSAKLQEMQSALQSKEADVDEVDAVAVAICQESPETRISQQTEQLRKRFEGTKSALSEQVDKLGSLFASKDAQNDAIQAFEVWLIDSKKKLQQFEELAKNANQPIPDEKVQKLNVLLKEKATGHDLLEKAIESGENLFAYIAPKDRDSIRAHIREMRDSWENHIDYMTHVQKTVDAVALKWRSFEDNHKQVRSWLQTTNAAVDKDLPKMISLADKKASHQACKAVLQDVLSHAAIVENLGAQAKSLNNAEVTKKMTDTTSDYSKLKDKAAKKLDAIQKQVANYEKYNAALEKCRDVISNAEKDLELLMITPIETGETAKRVEAVRALVQGEKGCDKLLSQCSELQQDVLTGTDPSQRAEIQQELENLKSSWQNHLKRASNYQDQLQALTGQLEDLQREMELFGEWLTSKEKVLRDHTMKKDAASKQKYCATLRDTLKEVEAKEERLAKMMEAVTKVDQDSEIPSQVAHLNQRYVVVVKTLKEFLAKYEGFAKEHQSFDEQIEEFAAWIKAINEDLNKYGEVIGDLKVLQERRNNLEELDEMRSNECSKYESMVEQGEKLYSHTSPDGKEIVRAKLSALRSSWEQLSDDLQGATNKLDNCLQQFADFTGLQEQLTKWLRDIEAAMQEHTELRASLEEKKGQLQNHRIVHQEITTHNSLVDAVCNKARDLVNQTQDNSLTVYIESIKALFHNIGVKSKDLMDKLHSCVEEHTTYIGVMKSFTDFASTQSDLLTQCSDVAGDKKDLEKKISLLKELKENKDLGDKKIAELESLCLSVCKSTSPRGAQRLKKELQEVKESWSTHSALIDDVDINMEKAQGQWKQFNDDVLRHSEWFKKYEGIFRNQVLQGSLDEKQRQLETLNQNRIDVVDYEKTIDDFVNQSHVLLQNTGAEHLKPAITQASNRYQLLHVLSKEVVAKWQGLVEEHQNFEDKKREIDTKLTEIEGAMENVAKAIDLDKKADLLRFITTHMEQMPSKINNVGILGERLFADTSGLGREVIRKQLKEQRERYEELKENEENLKKRQDQQNQAWTLYKEALEQACQWMDTLEASPGQQDSPSKEQTNWLSPQETRSRLFKLKADLADVESHKRVIEAVNEKGAAVVQANTLADPAQIQGEIDALNERYGETLERVRSNVLSVEEALEYIQQYQDLQKHHLDWSKQMWNKLQVYTDYTGNKATVESRLGKVSKLSGNMSEGKTAIEKLKKSVAALGENRLPQRAKEAMERDLENVT